MTAGTDPAPVTFDTEEAVTVARFAGTEISSLEAIDELLLAFRNKIDTLGAQALVIDFTGMRFIATGAINLLLVVLKRMRLKGGDVYLCGVTGNVEQVFRLLQINKLFELFPSRAEAMRILRGRNIGKRP